MYLRREMIGMAHSESAPALEAAPMKAVFEACDCCSILASGDGALEPLAGSPKGAAVARVPAETEEVDRFLCAVEYEYEYEHSHKSTMKINIDHRQYFSKGIR